MDSSDQIVFNKLVFGFISNSKTVVYLKQSEDDKMYAVKVRHHDGTKISVKTSYSLSVALRALAEEVAGLTDGFTSWESL